MGSAAWKNYLNYLEGLEEAFKVRMDASTGRFKAWSGMSSEAVRDFRNKLDEDLLSRLEEDMKMLSDAKGSRMDLVEAMASGADKFQGTISGTKKQASVETQNEIVAAMVQGANKFNGAISH